MSEPRGLRALFSDARHGTLATIARDPPGWPFATLVAVAFDERWRPLFLLSGLAEHTKNLEACANASLLVAAGLDGDDDPLAAGRATILGSCTRVGGAEGELARGRFVRGHPEAAGYASFNDFAMWRLEVTGARWVGGFGRMAWLDADDYVAECAG